MNKFFLPIILVNLISISYANYLDDWTDEDLCRWMDADLIPEHISDEANMRNLSCYVSCSTSNLTAKIPSCNKDNNVSLYILELNMNDKDDENLFLSNPVFSGIDMSGYNPSEMQSSDMISYFINGQLQKGSSSGAAELKRYLESIGRGKVFSYNKNLFLSNPVFNGIDMSGYTPPKITSMDNRIYYINGHQQINGSTYVASLKRYLESTGQGSVFSLNPSTKINQPAPIKFDFKITF